MKIKAKTLIALLLVLAMAFSLAACGKGNQSGEEPAGNKGGNKEETPEFVYTAEFTELGGEGRNSLVPSVYTDDGFYASSYEKVGENIPEGAVVQYEGQYDVYQTRLYFVGFDGSRKLLEGYVPMTAPENTEGKRDYRSNSNISGMALGADGNLVVIEAMYTSWSEAPEGVTQESEEYWNYYQSTNQFFLRCLDETGAEISAAPIETQEGSYISGRGAVLDDAGNLLVTSDMQIRAIAPDGTTAYVIESENYLDNLVRLKDGRVGALNWGEKGMCLSLVDTAAKAFGEDIELPRDAYTLVSGGGDYDLYYTSGINFYGYKIDTQESVKLLNWINCDINGDEMQGVSVSSDGRITGVLNHWDNANQTTTTELVTLTKVPYDSVPHKETLTLAVQYLDWDVRSSIIDFNRKSDTVRIEVKDYSEYNTEDDYSAGLKKLTTEIMAGNMPDLLAMNGMPYAQLAAKGLLEDLYPYLDADSDFSRDDFFQNVFKALEVDGKLYATCPSFSVQTVMGAASVVGDTPGWTYQQLNEALATMPEGCTPFSVYTVRDDILQTCLALDMDNFVDWSTGECHFDSQEFIDLLNFAALFPESFDWEKYEYTPEDRDQSRIAEGKQMLMQASIYSFEDLQYNDANFGGQSTYIGYPTASGVGSMLNLTSGFAMSANCANKDAAWEFLRMFYTEDYQKNIWGLPTNLNVYNEKLKEAMTPQYQQDAEGNFLLDENGEKIPISTGGMGMPDGSVVEFYALTQEQADRLGDLINSTTRLADYNSSVFDIVKEQAQAFFAGQKSAEDVAKLIQSKANIYVNEQR